MVFLGTFVIGMQHLSWRLLPAACDLWLCLLCGQNSSNEIFLGHGVCIVLLFPCCYSRFPCFLGSCLWMILAIALKCQVLHSLGTTTHPSLAEDLPLCWHPMHLYLRIAAAFPWRKPWSHSYCWCFWLCYVSLGICCSRYIHILTMSASTMVHILLWLGRTLQLACAASLSLVALLLWI